MGHSSRGHGVPRPCSTHAQHMLSAQAGLCLFLHRSPGGVGWSPTPCEEPASRYQTLQGLHAAGVRRGQTADLEDMDPPRRITYGHWETDKHWRDPAWHDGMKCDAERESR